MKKAFIVFLCIAVLLVFAGAIHEAPKHDIHTATVEKLVEIDDIGDVLAYRILAHLEYNKDCSVDDLTCINGIGEKRLRNIKRHYY